MDHDLDAVGVAALVGMADEFDVLRCVRLHCAFPSAAVLARASRNRTTQFGNCTV
jgi:hypothetical protein